MTEKQWNRIEGLTSFMQEGGVYTPLLLLQTYHELGLTDTELLLLLQLMGFKQAEGVDFPTPEQLAERMGKTTQEIGQLLRRLMKEGMLMIDEHRDPVSGMQYERYNWSGWMDQAVELYLSRARSGKQESASQAGTEEAPPVSEVNLYTLFEQEFGRPLSPMELDMISGWLDEDKFSDELIRFALKEAVFAGKLYFRYIDRILLEWGRNRITNVDEARSHTQRYRNGKG
ncbi:DnaD domain-containing protein [Paenibacillus pinihumi]|uniref:DnaD domain-containing protein n=1 Tax=Paenibacillus pinihumi TaxID=669462 RepID=UPI000403B16F|nr:DnaD domain protein [Paenibacillus pinihumi]